MFVAILLWILGFIVIVGAPIALSFVIDRFMQHKLKSKVKIRSEAHGNGQSNLMVVFPGAFSEAKFQFEPIMASLRLNGYVLYVMESGEFQATLRQSTYDHKIVDKAALTMVGKFLQAHDTRRVTFVGISAGAGRAWQLATSLHESGQLAGVTTNFVAIDGVGSPDDLAGSGPFGAKYISRLPFGWLWNHIPIAKLIIRQPSETLLPEWKEHAQEGFSTARRTPTAVWAGQLRGMRATEVRPGSLDWVDRLVYIQSTLDTTTVDAEQSIATWRAASGHLDVEEVRATHTNFEAAPLAYASIIQGVLDD